MAITRERLTVAGTAVPLTAATHVGAQFATLTVETAAIRFTLNGTAPVAGTTGHLVSAGQIIELYGREQIVGFQAIRDTGVSAAIEATYRSTP